MKSLLFSPILDQFSPVLVKEMRGRMRGARAFIILTAVLAGFGGFSGIMYLALANTPVWDPRMASSAHIGQSLFRSLILFETFLLLLIVPGLSAGTISQEHEARTYEMLVATPLPPTGIVIGKMGSVLSYVLLLLVALLPFTSLFFVLGGVTTGDILTSLAVLALISASLVAVCTFLSALFKRTGRSIVASYLLVAALVLVPYFGYVVHGIFLNNTPPRFWLVLSPLSAVSSAFEASPDSLFGVIGEGAERSPLARHPTWHFSVLVYTFLLVTGVIGAAHFVRPTGHRWARRRELAALAFSWGVLLLIALAVFRPDDWRSLVTPPLPQLRQEIVPLEPPPGPVPTPAPTATPLPQKE